MLSPSRVYAPRCRVLLAGSSEAALLDTSSGGVRGSCPVVPALPMPPGRRPRSLLPAELAAAFRAAVLSSGEAVGGEMASEAGGRASPGWSSGGEGASSAGSISGGSRPEGGAGTRLGGELAAGPWGTGWTKQLAALAEQHALLELASLVKNTAGSPQ